MKRKLHWTFWFELGNLLVLTPLNGYICYLNLHNGHPYVAVLPAMAVLIVLWNSRRVADFCIIQFCMWYMGRVATRMLKRAKAAMK